MVSAKLDISDKLADPLLSYLRDTLAVPNLVFGSPLRRLCGGNQNAVYAFEIDPAPASFDSRLVLRILHPSAPAWRSACEETVQNTLAELGYPVPRVLCSESNTNFLGAGFIIMEHRPGIPVVGELVDPESDGISRPTISDLIGQLSRTVRAPQVLARVHARLHELQAHTLYMALEDRNIDPSLITVDARLGEIQQRIRSESLDAFLPALSWLETNLVPPSHLVICHGDIQPNNVLVEGGCVSTVLDWTHIRLADASLDIGFTKMALETAPIEFPVPIRAVSRWIQRKLAKRYLEAYLKERPLNPDAVAYFEAFRCIDILTLLAERQAHKIEEPDAWNSTLGVTRLLEHFQRVTGVDLIREEILLFA